MFVSGPIRDFLRDAVGQVLTDGFGGSLFPCVALLDPLVGCFHFGKLVDDLSEFDGAAVISWSAPLTPVPFIIMIDADSDCCSTVAGVRSTTA